MKYAYSSIFNINNKRSNEEACGGNAFNAMDFRLSAPDQTSAKVCICQLSLAIPPFLKECDEGTPERLT